MNGNNFHLIRASSIPMTQWIARISNFLPFSMSSLLERVRRKNFLLFFFYFFFFFYAIYIQTNRLNEIDNGICALHLAQFSCRFECQSVSQACEWRDQNPLPKNDSTILYYRRNLSINLNFHELRWREKRGKFSCFSFYLARILWLILFECFYITVSFRSKVFLPLSI